MKVLIIGASGLIGESLVRKFSKKHKVLGVDIEPLDSKILKADMTDFPAINRILSEFRPEVVLVPAAYPNVDGCEENPDACMSVNVNGPENAGMTAEALGAKFIFFSSDYIFDGGAGPYDEDSLPNPISEYGEQKLAVEKFIADSIKEYLIIRTTVVYGPETRGKNFAMSLIRRLRRREKVKVPYDQAGTPTYSPDLAEAVLKLVEKGANGTFNVAGPELTDRLRFAQTICDVFGLDKGLLVPVKTSELGQKAKRPLNAGLRIDKLLSTVEVRMRAPAEALEELKEMLN